MKVEIKMDVWDIDKIIESMVIEETKEKLKYYLNENSWFLREIAADVARNFTNAILFDENNQHKNIRNEILAMIVKSMTDDEKKLMLIDALIRKRD